MENSFRRSIILYITILLMIFLQGCARGDVPLTEVSPTEDPTPVVATEIIPTITPESIQRYSLDMEYAAVWVVKEEGLHVRNPAGISGSIVVDLPWNARQIFLTDNRSLLGSSLWVEILTNGDVTGWINAWNITEYVPTEEFCADERVIGLIDRFQEIISSPQDPAIQEMISPNHGLSVRHNWYNLDITFETEDILNRLSDAGEINWGIMADSGLEVLGTFDEVIRPKLDDVFLSQNESRCNEIQWGNTSGEVQWPDEFQNLNYYSFYRPAPEDGNAFDWRTWALGIEYVDSQPFIAVIVHYSSEL